MYTHMHRMNNIKFGFFLFILFKPTHALFLKHIYIHI